MCSCVIGFFCTTGDDKNVCVYFVYSIYCNICEHLSAWGVGGGLMNVSMCDWLSVHADVAGLVSTIIIPHLSSTYLLHM